MKLIVNGRFLSQQPTGVQNYAKGIVKELLKSGNIEIVAPSGQLPQSGFPVKKIGFFSGFIWEQIFLPLYMLGKKDAVLLNLCNSAPLFIRNQVVTIHDLAFEEKQNWFSPLFQAWYRFMIPRICKRAKLIVTVSEFSKRKIVEKYGIKESKIIIAPPGIPEFKFSQNKQDIGDYVLLTGIADPRKNADFIIEYIDQLKQKGLKLVALGDDQGPFQSGSIQQNESILYLKHVSFPEYCPLVKNAKVLIYPSYYEGFGIPILESLCMGTPVIASDIEVFKENFGNMPIYFNIGDINSYCKAIDSLAGKKISPGDIEFLKNKFNFNLSVSQIVQAISSTT
jgi:glycosyltransferase involved in cell wall biosynthesis